MLDVSIIKCLSDNYSYLIRDKKTNLVGVVDPSEFKPIDKEINKVIGINENRTSEIKKSNLETKNLFSKLGIFLLS